MISSDLKNPQIKIQLKRHIGKCPSKYILTRTKRQRLQTHSKKCLKPLLASVIMTNAKTMISLVQKKSIKVDFKVRILSSETTLIPTTFSDNFLENKTYSQKCIECKEVKAQGCQAEWADLLSRFILLQVEVSVFLLDQWEVEIRLETHLANQDSANSKLDDKDQSMTTQMKIY